MTIALPTAASIMAAATLLKEGRLVAFPTETVYGLGGDATNERAVAAIFEAKGRPQFNPLISHVLDAEGLVCTGCIEGFQQHARQQVHGPERLRGWCEARHEAVAQQALQQGAVAADHVHRHVP